MKEVYCKATFNFDEEGTDYAEFKLIVPEEVTVVQITDVCNSMCDKLNYMGVFADEGRHYETLLKYVCNNTGWKYEKIKYDISFNF